MLDHNNFYSIDYNNLWLYSNPFTDISESDWYYNNVTYSAYSGLMECVSENTFSPSSSLTVAQAVALAARLHSSHYNEMVRALS